MAVSFSANAEAGQLQLSGYVPPTMSAVVELVHDGLSLRNAGNEIALFQMGSRNSSMQRSAQLSQGQAITLRTEYVEHRGAGSGPIEIRIMAP